MRWHFTEKGHGKGAPDGIGGCIKRTADRLIGQRKDIPDINCLVEGIKEKCPSVTIYTINNKDFNIYEKCVPENLTTFKGTLQVHEVFWSSTKKETL